MMATTHVLVGLAIAALASLLVPDLTVVAVGAAAVGGIFPDLDLYSGHRKTLHFPVYYSFAAVLAIAVAALAPEPVAWAVALFLAAAAVHSVMDVFGGGLELRPWRGTSDRAVYSHYHRRWVSPRRWVPYDGSPTDLGLAAAVAVPGLVQFDGGIALWITALLALSAVYVVLRKPMVAVAEWLVVRVPPTVATRLPHRFLEEVP